MSRQNISSVQRLRSLPDLFRGSDLTTRFGWTSKTASQYLYLWRRGETPLIAPFGGHSDVFANILFYPEVSWERALLMAMPSSTIIGVEALRRAGWVTQIPRRPEVAVRADRPVFQTNPFEITPRNPEWFLQTEGHTETADQRVRTLRPAWALADMLATQGWGTCGVWPDDIDWELVDDDQRAQWLCACQAFGIDEHDLLDWETDARQCVPGQPLCVLNTTSSRPRKFRTPKSVPDSSKSEPEYTP